MDVYFIRSITESLVRSLLRATTVILDIKLEFHFGSSFARPASVGQNEIMPRVFTELGVHSCLSRNFRLARSTFKQRLPPSHSPL